MGVKFFGQYLVEKQVVVADQIREAIEFQERTNISFEALAVEIGIVAASEVARARKQQQKEPVSMEIMLVQMGYMTTFQREAVINRQRARHIYLGQALVELGHVSHETIEEHLAAFDIDQAVFRTGEVRLPAGIPHLEFCRDTADVASKLLTLVAWIKHRLEDGRVVTQFLGHDHIVTMTLVGDVSGMFVVSASHHAAVAIARAFLNHEDAEHLPHEVLIDAVKEFANVVCGSAVAKAAQIGLKVDIVPPDEFPVEADRVVHVPEDMVGLFLPLVVAGDSALDFAILLNH